MDDELIEKGRCALLLALASDSKSHSVDNLARAAIQAVREWDTARSVVETSLSESLKKMWRAELASIGSKLE